MDRIRGSYCIYCSVRVFSQMDVPQLVMYQTCIYTYFSLFSMVRVQLLSVCLIIFSGSWVQAQKRARKRHRYSFIFILMIFLNKQAINNHRIKVGINDYKNYMMNITKHSGHGRSEITKIITNPYSVQTSQIISIAHDGYIRVWNLPSLTLQKQVKILSPYLTSILPFQNGFLLSLGNGELIKLSENLQTQKTYKFHDDCITDIAVYKQYLVTVGYDGIVNFISEFEIKHTISFEVPIIQCKIIKDKMYLAGNPSFEVSITDNYSVKELDRFNSLIYFHDLLFGNSDEVGITCIDTNKYSNVPCQFMLPLQNKILVISEESVGFLQLYEEKLYWNAHKDSIFQKGYSILTGINTEHGIILGGQCGSIYVLRQK